jgi:hypothetical protein
MLPGITTHRATLAGGGIVETVPIGMAGVHLAVPLLFLGLLYQGFRGGLCILRSRWKTRPKESLTTFTGAKPGGSGTVSRRLPGSVDVSLCQRQEIAMVRGREISRPEAALRCGVCDGLEMERRGWKGSGPVSLRRSISR